MPLFVAWAYLLQVCATFHRSRRHPIRLSHLDLFPVFYFLGNPKLRLFIVPVMLMNSNGQTFDLDALALRTYFPS